eukprot:25804-Eustigmatos_ZCMA.PRE.1
MTAVCRQDMQTTYASEVLAIMHGFSEKRLAKFHRCSCFSCGNPATATCACWQRYVTRATTPVLRSR